MNRPGLVNFGLRQAQPGKNPGSDYRILANGGELGGLVGVYLPKSPLRKLYRLVGKTMKIIFFFFTGLVVSVNFFIFYSDASENKVWKVIFEHFLPYIFF